MPVVSVILPVYNGETLIARALDSVLRQTLTDWECILINDGSTDGTADVLSSFTDPRIRVLTLPNGGVSRARNAGLAQATGETLAFLDSDDYLDPNALETLWDLMQWTGGDIAVAGLVMEDRQGFPLPRTPEEGDPARLTPAEAAKLCFIGAPFAGYLHAKLLRRELVQELRFDNTLSIYEDMLYFLQALRQARSVSYAPKRVHHYMVDEGAMRAALTQRKASSLAACDQMLLLTQQAFAEASDEARLFAVRNALWFCEELNDAPRATRDEAWAVCARKEACAQAALPCDTRRLPRVQRLFLRCLRAGYPLYSLVYRGLYRPFTRLRALGH